MRVSWHSRVHQFNSVASVGAPCFRVPHGVQHHAFRPPPPSTSAGFQAFVHEHARSREARQRDVHDVLLGCLRARSRQAARVFVAAAGQQAIGVHMISRRGVSLGLQAIVMFQQRS